MITSRVRPVKGRSGSGYQVLRASAIAALARRPFKGSGSISTSQHSVKLPLASPAAAGPVAVPFVEG